MLANNNDRVITRLARRALFGNVRKNMFILASIVLSSFMIFSILTVGVTFFQMQEIQNIRMNGCDMDGILYGITAQQEKTLRENEKISQIGQIGISGYAVSTEKDDTLNTGLIWSDNNYWDIQMAPAREWAAGEYPQKDNEVMATKAALEDLGYPDLELGDTFTLTYADNNGEHTREFVISGMWGGYGEKKVLYVSESFYKESGFHLDDVYSGRLYLNLKNKWITEKEQTEIMESMNLGKQQTLFFTVETANAVQILAGLAGLASVTCLSAYLLIYNIMYLAVAGNVRYYGLLQTVGMTEKQIHRMMCRQMQYLGIAGIVGGMFLGSAVSFALIPSVVKMLGIHQNDIHVDFHLSIFLLTIAGTALTIYAGGRKPVRMASSVSPIEALGHRSAKNKKTLHKTRKCSLILKMALEQFFQDKKKTGVVVLSLAASLSVFLCLITLIESQGARTIISNYMDTDMTIVNDTMKNDDPAKWEQLLDEKFLGRLRSDPGIREVHPILTADIIVPWEPEFSDIWMREFYETWMRIPYEEAVADYKEHPENFVSVMVGIDETEFAGLNETLESPVDREEFLEGKSCILYRDQLAFDMKKLGGKSIKFYPGGDMEQEFDIQIAGLADDGYYRTGSGNGPVIIVSDTLFSDNHMDSLVAKAGIYYAEEYDEEAEARVLSLMDESDSARDFSYDSKIESMKSVEKAQGNMLGVGIGIAMILGLIGVMNYINTVTGNIQKRQVELAVMESVGMTERQVKKMLVMEGVMIAGGSLLLTATAGLSITYILYQSMNYRRIPFSVPGLPVAVMLVFVSLVCISVPLVAYRMITGKRPIVERIKGFDY